MKMKHIIKKILKEENLKQSLKRQVKDFGIQGAAELVGGMDNFFSIMDFESPIEFLNQFNDLNVVQSEKNPDWILFRYNPKENIIIYDRKTEYVYISNEEIWSLLLKYFGLTYPETRQLTKRWLSEVYNLNGVTTFWVSNPEWIRSV